MALGLLLQRCGVIQKTQGLYIEYNSDVSVAILWPSSDYTTIKIVSLVQWRTFLALMDLGVNDIHATCLVDQLLFKIDTDFE